MRILFVCLGNICRSPTAEAAVREAAAAAGVDLDVESAGTAAYHVDEPPDARMRAAGSEVGLTLDGRARQVEVTDFDEFDLLLAMDRSNLRDLQRLAPSPEAATKVRLFRDFDPEAGDGAEVPDPYYGGPDGFNEVVEMARRTAHALVEAIAAERV